MKQLVAIAFLLLFAGMPPPPSAAQAGDSLANTSWVLREYAVQHAAFVPAVGEQRPTLVFGGDGRVSGSTGCNSFGGAYEQTGDQATFSEIVSTLRACVDQEMAAQEQVMLRVLQGNVAVKQTGTTLTLSAPAGALTFAAANRQNNAPAQPGMPATGAGMLEAGASAACWPALLLALGAGLIALGARLRRAWQRPVGRKQ